MLAGGRDPLDDVRAAGRAARRAPPGAARGPRPRPGPVPAAAFGASPWRRRRPPTRPDRCRGPGRAGDPASPRPARRPPRPAGNWTIRVTGGGSGALASGSNGFVMPVSLRVPDGDRRTAHGRMLAAAPAVPFAAAARSASVIPAANASSSASSYSSSAFVPAHQTCSSATLRRKWSHIPDAAGLASPGTVFVIAATRPATEPAVLPMCRTGLVRQPERGEPLQQLARPGSLAVEPQLRHPLEPLADEREVQGRRRQRRGELDDEHAGRRMADRPAPLRGAVGDQPDLAQEIGGGGGVGHDRSGPPRAWGWAGRRGRARDGAPVAPSVSSLRHAERADPAPPCARCGLDPPGWPVPSVIARP